MKIFRRFRQAGFAGIELVLLVTMVVGVAAAVRLALEPQNPQKQAATSTSCTSAGQTCTTDLNCPGKCGYVGSILKCGDIVRRSDMHNRFKLSWKMRLCRLYFKMRRYC
ncbi:MAG: hypothetical protein UV73_C0007G0013 [Candidatus Gottesmanbacteria bacterium GW2011_GWA2_43_14]|uniref:Uncharacterized protein n=1 Tax=Candidatus Gottesmanbacteria bacterium GW2011_GWA2_43_14 TaxID=1618443 RepID=A0A0G1DIA9_9BACT|nr:MAG: hypothetical protein UV73_C0007G0013 [Candidatus Gottesmanbacteria bacterium GW2011_GWA2_43_14]